MTAETKAINTTALAFIGDGVYEVYIRQHVLKKGTPHADRLHQMAVRYVRAEGQARVVKRLLAEGNLTEEETVLVKRARNHRSATKPKNADPVTYKLATAFEALIGALYLDGEVSRMEEIISRAIEITEES
jgi:ribonuclease-3 family protein